MDERSDDDLLAATRAEPEAFAVFYRRHVGPLLAYFQVGLDLLWTGIVAGTLAYGGHRLKEMRR